MKYSLFLLLVVVAICGQIAVGQDAAAAAYDVPEAYVVYSALLDGGDAKMVIRIETADYPVPGGGKDYDCLVPTKGEEKVYAPVIAAYNAINEKTWLLQRKLETRKPYELISKQSIGDLFKKEGVMGGWKAFYKKYPDSGGFVTLSAVGFNADKTIAIVYLGNSCGSLCGGGTYHVLQKIDGKWIKTEGKIRTCAWAS